MSWAARNLAAYLDGGVSITSITPNTGALSTAGQDAHVRPIHGNATSLTLTGQQPRLNIGIRPGTGSLTLSGTAAGAASQSQIISKEYTGDGAPTRSFASAGFLPLFVVVVGKDGSGNVVGAVKNAFMPATESQPFQEAIVAGGAARLNRIISLDANGFTVGPDLNVNGRKYAYIMFPAGRFGAVTSGTYVGNTVTAPGHAALIVGATQISGNPSGATQFVKPQYCLPTWYRPAGSTPYTPGTPLILGGRRMIRTSDNAILAEATEYINDSSCFGIGYIIGNESNWYWEDQYIELHTLVPDLLLIMSDDSPGQGTPGTVAPPPTNSTIGWSANSIGAPAFFASASEAVLHIPDTNGLSYNADGMRFHWMALKGDEAGSGGVRMKTFQYTGTGDGGSPIDLVGCGFDPEWVYLERAGDQFHWSKRTTNIVGLHNSRRWLDGSGDHINTNPAYTVDFITDGVRLPATNSIWNVLGNEYTVVCIGVADPAENTRITPNTGSLIITPKNPTRAQKRLITPATGTLRLDGKAIKTKETHTPGPPPKKFHEQPDTDELQITGRQPVLKRGIRPLAGTLSAMGQRAFVRPPDFIVLPQAGALSLTGQQPKQRITITPGTGALTVNGRAAILSQSVPPRRTIDTQDMALTPSQPILKVSIIPSTGELQLQTFNTEPIVQSNVTKITPNTGTLNFLGDVPTVTEGAGVISITPNTGSLVLTGQQPTQKLSVFPNTGQILSEGEQPDEMTEFYNVPFTGALTLTGYQPIVQVTQSGASITPGTGALNLVGRRPIIVAPTPPTPPTPGPSTSGPALPTPRKLPFWPKTIITARGRIVQPAPTFRGLASVEENELAIFLE